jgi:NADPH:quinone reductase-like Zn-dependent oxidoreductase
MIAVEYDAFGPATVLDVRQVSPPRDCATDEIQVMVASTSVNPKDTFVRKGRFAGLTGTTFPRRVGYDWAGTVAAVGSAAGDFWVGQTVYGMLNGWNGGACAAIINVKGRESANAPSRYPISDCAAIPLAGQTALQALVDVARLQPGQRILINGASGGVGSIGIQIARYLGASVVAVARGSNEDMCRDLGADTFIDYADDTIFKARGEYDVIFDVFGALRFIDCEPLLTESGILVTTVPSAANLADISSSSKRPGKIMRLVAVQSREHDLALLAQLVKVSFRSSSIEHIQ